MDYDKEFPITEQPQPLIEWEDGDILGKCYNQAPEESDRAIQAAGRLRYFRRDSASKRIITKLIPLADGLDRLLAGRDEEILRSNEVLQNWIKSLEALRTRLLSIMEREGLVPAVSVGKALDLDIHEVVEVRGSNQNGEPVVVEEFQKGYLFDNRVVRDARVVVERIPTRDLESFQPGTERPRKEE